MLSISCALNSVFVWDLPARCASVCHSHSHACIHTHTHTPTQILHCSCCLSAQRAGNKLHSLLMCVCVLAPLLLLLLFSLLLCCCICLLHLIMQNTASPLGAPLPATPLRRLHAGIGIQQLQLHAKFIMCTKNNAKGSTCCCWLSFRLPVAGWRRGHAPQSTSFENKQTNKLTTSCSPAHAAYAQHFA